MNPYALALFVAELAGAAIVGVLLTMLFSAAWRRHDRRTLLARQAAAARVEASLDRCHEAMVEEDRRLLGEVRRICETGR